MCGAVHAGLSISMQNRLLPINRSSFYYAPQPEYDEMLAMMLVIDAIVPQPALTLQSATGAPSEAPSCEHWQSWGAAVDCQDGAVAYLPAAEDERPAPAASD